jgi:hypothetical protein
MIYTLQVKQQYALSIPFVTSFAIPFPYWQSEEIKAILSNGIESKPLTIQTDYSVSVPNGFNGTLTALSDWQAMTSGWKGTVQITIIRETQAYQEVDLKNGARLDADLIERMIDHAIALSHEKSELASRTIKAPITDSNPQLELPPQDKRKNTYLKFDSLGNVIADILQALEVLEKLLTVDGANSGLDADLLDGKHGDYYQDASHLTQGTLDEKRLPAYTGDVTAQGGSAELALVAARVLEKLLTVDGTNSGLDADLLDGKHGDYYQDASHLTQGTLDEKRLPKDLNAETLNGYDSAFYRDASNLKTGTLDMARLPETIRPGTIVPDITGLYPIIQTRGKDLFYIFDTQTETLRKIDYHDLFEVINAEKIKVGFSVVSGCIAYWPCDELKPIVRVQSYLDMAYTTRRDFAGFTIAGGSVAAASIICGGTL